MCNRKILANAQKCINYGKIVPKKYHFESSSKLSQLGHFLFHCPFKRGYFSSVDLEMGVRVRLREVSAYGNVEFQL